MVMFKRHLNPQFGSVTSHELQCPHNLPMMSTVSLIFLQRSTDAYWCLTVVLHIPTFLSEQFFHVFTFQLCIFLGKCLLKSSSFLKKNMVYLFDKCLHWCCCLRGCGTFSKQNVAGGSMCVPGKGFVPFPV